MESPSVRALWGRAGAGLGRLLLGLACLGFASAQAVTITVKGSDGTDVQTFRYTIQEDPTYDVVPDVTGLTGNADTDPSLALAFHRSYAKIVKVGRATNGQVDFTPPVAASRYFVTVMPDNEGFGAAVPTGFTMNGVAIKPGALSVVVPVNKLPFKTAQVSVFVFEDNAPVNGAADAPGEQEMPLCGFEIQLFEAGGTYGASGGRVSTDTFGNPLGTEYAFDASGAPQYNSDGSLAIAKLGSNQLWSDRNGVVRIKNLSPAKYTIYSIAPNDMPSASRCNFGDAAKTPIWVRTPAQRTHRDANGNLDQMVWDSPFEFKAGPNDTSKWHQTTTIEGTWGVDAWVKAGEPTFFKEFGPPGHHVWHGFVRRFKDTSSSGLLANGGATVTGKVVSTHMSRPPGIKFFSGKPMESCWIGISEVVTGTGLGRTLYANACDQRPGHEGEFSVAGLRPGQRYQLNVWDEPLDNVIANYEFSVPAAGGTVALNDVPVFSWFSNLQGKVFYDTDNTGFLFDAAGSEKPGIPNSILNIRFRDGSIYQSTITDDEGKYEFPEFFPFFNWMVAETDFTRFKSTGATVIADNGGQVVNPNGTALDSLGNPVTFTAPAGLWPANTLQPQINPDTQRPWRIFGFDNPDGTGAQGPSSANLLQGIQGFLGQTNVIHWGKKEYDRTNPNDHGGITGIVHYAGTRAEFDPKFAVAENNEPGIPSVEVRLYQMNNQGQVVSPSRGPISPTIADARDAVQVVVSDNWDKMQPTECVDPQPYTDRTGLSFQTGNSPSKSRCYDGMRVWNQVRDGAFDGGWAFVDYCPGGAVATRVSTDPNSELVVGDDNGITVQCVGGGDPLPLPAGRYMTEAVAPYGYEHQKEEDKNVDFGDLLSPGTLANPVECIGSRDEARDGEGNLYSGLLGGAFLVPAELELFPGVEIPGRFRDVDLGNGNYLRRPYCNKKAVVIAPGMNPFSDFHMFSKAAPAGHIVGMILDDLANEFDPYAPSFGEKYAPPFMPISIRDYAGNEINRVYSDRYGTYNALVPSTFAYNVPLPSGVAPNMVNVCLNAPTMKDANGNTVLDPHYNPQYSQYCYTFQYLPGKTTYLDTPVLPIAAFAGPSQYALDTEAADSVPAIKMVTGTTTVNGVEPGPWVQAAGQTVRVVSMGKTKVSNPNYDQTNLGNPANAGVAPKSFERDYGFGAAQGQVLLDGVAIPAGNITAWTDSEVRFTVPAGTTTGRTIQVVKSTGQRTLRGVTLHVGGVTPKTVGQGAGYAFQSVQAAIDAAAQGDLITVAPGVYEEAPIVWKRVRVQGYGAPATIINAAMGAEYLRQQAWREKVCNLVFTRQATDGNRTMADALVPGQTLPADLNACLTGDTADNAPLLFATEEASGFFILQHVFVANNNNQAFARSNVAALQIDGFTVTGADTGGGIVANGHAVQLQISNNRITGNQGLYNGGIRIGHADLLVQTTAANGDTVEAPGGSNNPLVNIHHNEIVKNGNLAGEVSGGGGGISIYTGAPGYRVANNLIAGNFSTGDGGGMAHVGRSGTLTVTGVNRTNNGGGNFGGFISQDNRVCTTGNNNPTVCPNTGGFNNGSLNFASTVYDNQFLFNQSFSQAKTVQGGGLAVMGAPDPVANNGLSAGTGNVVVANNTFQGNLAGAGDGGGIALVGVNGTEVPTGGPGSNTLTGWFRVDIVNNVIVNNGAGVAGGGISLLDSSNVGIVNNTIALNDSYATASRAFGNGDPTQAANGTTNASRIATSTLQNGAGIAAYGHSTAFRAYLGNGGPAAHRFFSNPSITDTVVVANRRYQWQVNYNVPQDQAQCRYDATTGINPCFGLGHVVNGALVAGAAPITDVGNDIAVIGSTQANSKLSPTYSVFTALSNAIAGDGTNFAAGNNNRAGTSSDFASWYANGQNGSLAQLVFAVEQSIVKGAPIGEVQEPTTATTAAAFDEGGNFIDVRFGPLTTGTCVTLLHSPACTTAWTEFGTYHPTATATSVDFGTGLRIVPNTASYVTTLLQRDRNGVARPTTNTGNWVRGAFMQ